jgi:hypothetical protein
VNTITSDLSNTSNSIKNKKMLRLPSRLISSAYGSVCRTLSDSAKPIVAVFAPSDYPLPVSDRVLLIHVSEESQRSAAQLRQIAQTQALIWVSPSKNSNQSENLISLWPKLNNVTWIHSIFGRWVLFI